MLGAGGAHVAHELLALIARHGKPLMVVSNNGTERTSSAILRGSQEMAVAWHDIAPGKPQHNTSDLKHQSPDRCYF